MEYIESRPVNPPTSAAHKRKVIDCDDEDSKTGLCAPGPCAKSVNPVEGELVSPKKPRRKKKKLDEDGCEVVQEEKRLRRFRKAPPGSYLEIKERALTQRLTIQDRERCGTDQLPEEKVLIAGSTGNLYTVQVKQVPSCDCPHAKKGNQCKHIIYVMLRVLKAPEHIAYQLALTSSELREVFKNAPPIPKADSEDDTNDGHRKPIEGDCPICYCEFEDTKDTIVYCKTGCGNNVHKSCMQQWAQVQKGKTTCPYCRSRWADDTPLGNKVDVTTATRTDEGYINIADQLGLSGERGMFYGLLPVDVSDFAQITPPTINLGFVLVLGEVIGVTVLEATTFD
ncbi:hypothetical protein M011DRAFT_481722 [Sporormia fimetaria CBS 119925]|uniref:Uncharacterized protein n=1 Tax=Sporormia fimetaria CBS 119925 TaxID=1340428 RepID=A0A6A6UZA5_9PLEO|nr:hypothetical protein M011DRAFT_481722 [Sporormia fimetaria CBS 119925]